MTAAVPGTPAPPPSPGGTPPGAPAPPPVPAAGAGPSPADRRAPSPFLAIIGYTLRACLPAKRWWGVVLPCLAALGFGWLATVDDTTSVHRSFADVAEHGLFGLVLPLTCLVLGDAVMGADIRAGTFSLTWLSPVRFPTIVVGRWLGAWLVALATLVPAMVLATAVADLPEGAGPMALATATGSAAYLGLFVMIGVLVRRSAAWSLAVVLLGEQVVGGSLSAIAQISPMWEAQQVYAGLADDAGGWFLLREGTPNGGGAVVRLAAILVVTLAVATWRLGRLRPPDGDE
ncbi:MAG TPA: hypothetical protein VKZ72_11310 [Acidimicrobiales bacterium]|jgi:hypothetical protein|nr:hypothetical protein [Acidimicrobiales bacterium]